MKTDRQLENILMFIGRCLCVLIWIFALLSLPLLVLLILVCTLHTLFTP